ncbi:ABC-type oligopeptide transporter ABCB9-like isoform X2 [Ptychodera flava]|uniref:ABC-type oligopeptide transporter ABCB9-like isoform X2 n=1 Tax=Ptychodera flava TaxID=63121 RepID=UPI003969D07C
MACSCLLLLAFVLSLLDVGITTVLFVHGDQFHKFVTEVYQFSYKDCFVDIWFLSPLRFSIIFGACIAVHCNGRNAAPRLQNSKNYILTIGGLMFLYLIIKLLIYSKLDKKLNEPWFWGLFAWTTVAALLPYACWRILSRIKPKTLNLHINAEDGTFHENEKLLHNHVGDDADLKGYDSDSDSDDGSQDGKDQKKKKLQTGSLLRLLSYSAPDWSFLLSGILALLATSAGEIFLPMFTGQVVDGIVVEHSYKKFTDAIIIMSLLSVGIAITVGVRGTLTTIVIARLNIRIRNLLFCAITKQEIGFFDTTTTGDITSRFTSDITVMSYAIGLTFKIFLLIVKIVGYLVMMFKLSWRLTVVTLIGIPLITVASKLYGQYYKKLSNMAQETLAIANNVAEETVSSMKTVRCFANEETENQRYADKLKDTYKVRLKQSFAYGGFMVTNRILELAMRVVVLYYGGHLVLAGTITTGHLISFVLYNLRLGTALESVGNVYSGLMKAAGAAEKVFELLDRVPKIKNDGRLLPGNIQGELEFRNVSFAYPTRPDTDVLKNVSFKVSPGEVIALVGPSGGGKSTCVNLIEHFYKPTSGEVLMDNIPIQDYDHKYLHTKVALVGQEPVLYGRSIKENISYGLDECNLQEVQRAAQLANAHKFVTELKDGYDTETGEKGAQLSVYVFLMVHVTGVYAFVYTIRTSIQVANIQ